MRVYSCQCGATVSQGSLPPHPCQGCKLCGTDLTDGTPHQAPEPHQYEARYVETDAGLMTDTRCKWCYRRKI